MIVNLTCFSGIVTRRIGGLEMSVKALSVCMPVTRRIGGLESCGLYRKWRFIVTRRIGGLEMPILTCTLT